MLNPVTYYFETPITGDVRDGGKTVAWTIIEATFDFVRDSKPQPPDWLVFKCHQELRDKNGNAIAIEILSLLDLEGGIDRAFRREMGAAWDAIDAA